tara:strand:+ start:556 stop:723 length:168 start_codon:yes stop_codon:yes gene_type:complete
MAKLQTIFLKSLILLEIEDSKIKVVKIASKINIFHQIAFFFTIFLIKDLKSSNST